MAKYTLKPITKRKYHRDSTMSKAEIMLVMILFHDSGYPLSEAFLSGKDLQAYAPSFSKGCLI